MTHLVTGGSGFLGNLIARRLHSRGQRVKVLDIWEDPTRPKEIEFIHCDICDRDGVGKAMCGIEVVHHNAALVPLTKSGARFCPALKKAALPEHRLVMLVAEAVVPPPPANAAACAKAAQLDAVGMPLVSVWKPPNGPAKSASGFSAATATDMP